MTAALRPQAVAVPWALILTFLLWVPLSSVWVNGDGHDFARVVEIGLCLMCAVGTALDRRGPAMGRVTGAWLSALLILAVASTVAAPISSMAGRELSLLLGLASVAWSVARFNRASHTTALIVTISFAGAVYGALTLFGFAANLSVASTLRPHDLLLGYVNGRFFNHVQTSMLPLLGLATLYPFSNRHIARLAMFGLSVGLALLAVTEGRATGLALLLASTIATLLFPQCALPFLRSTATAGIIAAAVYAVVFVAVPRSAGVVIEVLHTDGVADTGSAHARFVLWHIALDGIRRAPWLGIGPMHFSHTWNSDAAHPHNVYLQVAEEWGLPILVLVLGIALAGLRALYRAVRDHSGDETDRRVGFALFTTVIAIGIDGMLSGNFVMPVSQVWIAVVFGVAIGWVRRTAPATSRTVPSRAATVFRLVPLVAMSWLAASIAPELGTHLLDHPGPAGTTRDAGAPRFWSNGWF